MLRMALLLLALWLSAEALAADPSTRQASAAIPATAGFVAAATFAGQFEVESSKLALQQAESPEVKAFAQHMVDDHLLAATRLQEAIALEGLKGPPLKFDASRKAKFEALRARHDAEFDKAYVADQRQAHDEAIALFQGYAQGGENARLRRLAAEQLPMLKSHREAVDRL